MKIRKLIEYILNLGQEDIVMEMANLNERHTGIKGFIYISTKQASHGPRVKYYSKLGPNAPFCAISVSQTPKVVSNSLPKNVLQKQIPEVIEWVKLNEQDLKLLWNNGNYWDDDQFDTFKRNLKKYQSKNKN